MLETASDDANTDTAASAVPTAASAGAPNADPLPATEEATSSAVRRGILYISPQHGVVRFRRGATSYHKKATPKL